MGTKVKAPPARNYGKETRDTLQAQIDLMPDLYAAEQEFQPQFAQLQMDIAKSMTPQLLDMYEETQPRLAAMDRQTLAAQREADIAAVEDLGPRAMEALDQMDTQKSGLMKTLMAQAQEEVDAGGSLTGREARQYQQNVRGSQAARGMGYGPSDALYEAAELQMGSERRQAQRRQNAMQTLAMRQATTADPFMAILGRPSAVNPMAAAAVAGQGQGYTPGQLFNPESGYANAINAGNYQGKLAARTATGANRGAMWGAGLSALGSFAGAGVGEGGRWGK